MKVQFVADFGYAEIGMVEEYPDAKAKRLIEKGVAVKWKKPVATPKKVKSKKQGVKNDE